MAVKRLCPKCNEGIIHKRGKDKLGHTIYRCTNCKATFKDPKDYTYNSIHSRGPATPCPKCGTKMRKEGFGSVGQQKYMCPKCRHHLAKGNTKYGVIPAELKSKIRLYLKFDGISVRDIAGHFKVGVTTVRHIKEEYQKG